MVVDKEEDAMPPSFNRLGYQISSKSLHFPIPEKRQLSTNDVFCNRELRFDAIRSIGFDMDYTLVQYQQPAFDQLAFDGAKECTYSLVVTVQCVDYITFCCRC
jgi:hypothetical protein